MLEPHPPGRGHEIGTGTGSGLADAQSLISGRLSTVRIPTFWGAIPLEPVSCWTGSPPSVGGLPSNPGLLNSSNANAPTAAVQSVVTLNITSTSMLDALVAGLLDNSTNGVNGTFQSVTYQVPFLGLDAPVTSALINAVVPSDGLCGAPQSSYPPPPPPPQSWAGAFVNAVCSFVTNPVGTIISIANAVYTAATEAAVLMTHLAQEAADFGGQLLARAAATLVSIGKLILSALEALLNWIIAQLRALFSPPVTQLNAAANTQAHQEGTSIVDAEQAGNQTQNGGNITQASAQGVGAGLGGTLFTISEMIAVVVAVAIGFATAFSLGGTVVMNVVLTLILSLISSVAIALLFSSVIPGLIWQADNIGNASCDKPGSYQTLNQPAWKVIVDTIGWYAAGFGGGTALIAIRAAGFPSTSVSWGVFLAFALALVALMFTLVTASLSNPIFEAVSLALAFISLAVDLKALLLPTTRLSPIAKTTGQVTIGLDFASIGGTLADALLS